MIVKVQKDKTIEESNPDLDLAGLFPLNHKSEYFKLVALSWDFESPFVKMRRAEKATLIAEFFGDNVEDILAFYESAAKVGTREQSLFQEYNQYNSDPIQAMEIAIGNQISAIAEDINNMGINISSSDDKTFDRFMKFATESDKIASNLISLRDKCIPEEEKEIMISATSADTVQNITNRRHRRFANKEGA